MFIDAAQQEGLRRIKMDRQLYQAVSAWLEAKKENIIDDIMRLVSIASVSDPAAQEGPFGAACRSCMDEMLKIGRDHGFHTENYEYYVGSIGNAEKNWDNMIGLWNHLDVVPAGNDWDYEPFRPVLKENCFLVGRGSQDNKGPAVGMLYVMQCLRELKAPLKHELCLFVGSDEERGMSDLEYYRKHYPVPRMSMIADSGFPVCYGEKGILEGSMCRETPLPAAVLDCGGGNAGNMIPDRAYVVLAGSEKLAEEARRRLPADSVESLDGAVRLTVRGKGGHSAFPEGSVNAIHELGRLVMSLENADGETRRLFRDIAYLSEECYGGNFHVGYRDEVSGPTTCAATVLKCENRRLTLHFNIRYAITDDAARIIAGMSEAAGACHMVWKTESDSAPNYFPREHPAVELLTKLYNELSGERKESFVMGGGTYARKLPGAFAYGIGGMKESAKEEALRKRLFREGHGGAHGPDEALNVNQLLKAMKIYAMALVELNDCPL